MLLECTSVNRWECVHAGACLRACMRASMHAYVRVCVCVFAASVALLSREGIVGYCAEVLAERIPYVRDNLSHIKLYHLPLFYIVNLNVMYNASTFLMSLDKFYEHSVIIWLLNWRKKNKNRNNNVAWLSTNSESDYARYGTYHSPVLEPEILTPTDWIMVGNTKSPI